jgi:hypothetical protein
MNPDLKFTEEQKRDRALPAGEKWRLILQSIRWAESQATVCRNIPAQRLAEQARKLKGH